MKRRVAALGSLGRARVVRIVLWWLVVATLVVVAARDDDDDDDDDGRDAEDVAVVLEGELAIASLKPVEVYPGSAVVLRHHGYDPQDSHDLVVEIDGAPVEVLRGAEDQIVVEIPSDMEEGTAVVRLRQGHRHSAAHTLRVKTLRARKLLRSLVGGLALFVFGLRTLARGLRGYAGHPLRTAIQRWTRGPARGLGFGAAVGGVGQSMLSVAAFVVGLLESRLLTFGTAIVVLLGAHVGAGTAILVLPLGISRQALWIVALGVVWITMARHRRGEAAGELILGLGLLFYGLSILRSGFQPLVGDPDVLPYLETLRRDDAVGLWARIGAGTVLGALLQGPGAAFGLVLSIGESTALLGQREGLEIMSATNLGASLGTFLLVLPFGRGAKRLAFAHLSICTLCTILFLVLVVPSMELSSAVLGTDPQEVAYGKKILLPSFASHLTLSFAVAQVVAVLLATPFARPVARAMLRLMPWRPRAKGDGPSPEVIADDPMERVSGTLVRALECDRRSLDATRALLAEGMRQQAATGAEEIATVRGEIKQEVERLGRGRGDDSAPALSACVAVLHLQRALEQLLQLAERGIEKDYTVDADTLQAFTSLHDLCEEGLRESTRHLRGTASLDIEQARTREITINAREVELRRQLLAAIHGADRRENEVLWRLEVLSAYESVGNHVYRIAEVLVEGDDDDF